MKVNYIIDENKVIRGYTIIPFNPAEPSIEVENESDIHVGYSQVIDGEFIANDAVYQEARAIIQARNAIKAEITSLKKQLSDTDYESLKFSEGEMTTEEFEPYKVQRHQWRLRIRELEEQLEEAE